jgi:signal transduction histidine kinase
LAATVIWQIGWVVLPIPALNPEREIGIMLSLSVLLTSLVVQIYRYRSVATPIQRQQTKWFLFGFAAGLLGVLVWATLFVALPPPPGPTRLLVNLIGTGVLVFSPLATVVCITIALLRFRLWEIDLVINRTLVYTAITVAIIAIYSLIVGGLGSLLHVQGNPLVAFVGAGVIALIFRPLADGVQQAVNRLMFGRRDEPYAVLAQLGHELQAAMLPEQGLRAVVVGITTSLKLPYAAIELMPTSDGVLTPPKPTDDRRPTTEREGSIVHRPHNAPTLFAYPDTPPQPSGTLLELPLTFQGEALGRLLVAPRSPGEPFSPREHRLLTAIADQAGAAASAVQLTLALQRSRERLVLAREEERRRIRRDLHDELGPTLASQTLRLDAAIDLIDAQPDRAAELLTTIKARNQAIVAEIRRLVYELRPPALDELGLLGALRAAVRQLGATTPQISFAGTPDPLPSLPAAVEVAAYRIALEAITNAIRHAEATRCAVRLELEGDRGTRKEGTLPLRTSGSRPAPTAALLLTISDDGRGIDPHAPRGVGLRSMRERAEELGGSLTITPTSGGGTTIMAWLPIPLDS